MKMKNTLIMLALAGAVGSASAADYWFDHSSTPGDDLWSSLGNWNTGALPTSADNVNLYPNAGAAGGLSQVDVTATVATLNFTSGNQHLEILPTGNLTVGAQAWNGIGNAGGEVQTLTLSGGTLDLDMGGTWFVVGENGSATLNMNGGLLKVQNGGLFMDINNTSSPVGYMTGGTMDLANLAIGNSGVLDITAGTIIIRGQDATGTLSGYYTNGQITIPGTSSITAFSYDEGTGDTTLTVIPEPATLGLVALMGGGILLIRKRFMI